MKPQKSMRKEPMSKQKKTQKLKARKSDRTPPAIRVATNARAGRKTITIKLS